MRKHTRIKQNNKLRGSFKMKTKQKATKFKENA